MPIFSFMFHWTALIWVWFQRSCPPAQVKCQSWQRTTSFPEFSLLIQERKILSRSKRGNTSLWTGSLSGEKIARKGKGRGERACRHTFEATIPPSCNYLAEHLSAGSLSVNQFRAWVTPGKIIIKRENIRVLLSLWTGSLSGEKRPVHRLSEHWKRGWTITVKLMTSRMVKGTWLHTGALWRLKGVQKVRSISFYLALWPYQRQYIWPIRSGQL